MKKYLRDHRRALYVGVELVKIIRRPGFEPGIKDLYAVYSPPLYQLSYRRLLYRPAKCFSMFVDCVFSVLT